ncbi:hypothetical protein WMF26_08485 [Sorangium sp. So ce185]|uniref:hypothetical protein n=1 Tax=Sorangium sp. So ce185 TaxID=3133287 RepID=UPI003F60DD8A
MNERRERTLLTSNHDALWVRIARIAAAICAILLTTSAVRANGTCRDAKQICSGDDDKTCVGKLSGLLFNLDAEVKNEIDALQRRVPAAPSASVATAVNDAKAKSGAFLASRQTASNAAGTDAEKRAAAVKAIDDHCVYVNARNQADQELSKPPAPPAAPPGGLAAPIQDCGDPAKASACVNQLFSEATKAEDDLKSAVAAGKRLAAKLSDDISAVAGRAEEIHDRLDEIDVAAIVDSLKKQANDPNLTDATKALKAYESLRAVSTLVAAAGALQAERQEIQQICASSCKAPGAFCIDARSGEPLCEGLTPDVYSLVGSLSPGDRLIVRVFGEAALKDALKLSVSFIRSSDRRFDAPEKGARAPATPPKLELLAEQTAEVPEDTSLTSLKIRYELAGDGPESAIDESYAVPIDHGQYYLEFGALFPLVIDGSRRVVQTTVPGAGGERRLSVQEDWSVNPSIVLNVFPGGRRRGVISSFQDMRLAATLGDLLGVQAGVDLDLGEPFDRIFLGGVIEPVAGLSFNAGLAFVQQEYLPAGHAEGMILPAFESISPVRRYAPRFYFGVTLTLDIVNTATTATTSFASALTR